MTIRKFVFFYFNSEFSSCFFCLSCYSIHRLFYNSTSVVFIYSSYFVITYHDYYRYAIFDSYVYVKFLNIFLILFIAKYITLIRSTLFFNSFIILSTVVAICLIILSSFFFFFSPFFIYDNVKIYLVLYYLYTSVFCTCNRYKIIVFDYCTL